VRKIVINAIHSQLGGVTIPPETETTIVECGDKRPLRIAVFHFRDESHEYQKSVLSGIVKSISDHTGDEVIAVALRAGSTFELFEEKS